MFQHQKQICQYSRLSTWVVHVKPTWNDICINFYKRFKRSQNARNFALFSSLSIQVCSHLFPFFGSALISSLSILFCPHLFPFNSVLLIFFFNSVYPHLFPFNSVQSSSLPFQFCSALISTFNSILSFSVMASSVHFQFSTVLTCSLSIQFCPNLFLFNSVLSSSVPFQFSSVLISFQFSSVLICSLTIQFCTNLF